jgi:hypothetical protein
MPRSSSRRSPTAPTEPTEVGDTNSQPPTAPSRWRHFPRFRWLLLAGLLGLAILWLAPTIAAFVADVDLESLERPVS